MVSQARTASRPWPCNFICICDVNQRRPVLALWLVEWLSTPKMKDKCRFLLPFAGLVVLFTILCQPAAKIHADGGDIATVAGKLGASGATGGGGPATTPKLDSPYHVVHHNGCNKAAMATRRK